MPLNNSIIEIGRGVTIEGQITIGTQECNFVFTEQDLVTQLTTQNDINLIEEPK